MVRVVRVRVTFRVVRVRVNNVAVARDKGRGNPLAKAINRAILPVLHQAADVGDRVADKVVDEVSSVADHVVDGIATGDAANPANRLS